jgi:hypothetical protein
MMKRIDDLQECGVRRSGRNSLGPYASLGIRSTDRETLPKSHTFVTLAGKGGSINGQARVGESPVCIVQELPQGLGVRFCIVDAWGYQAVQETPPGPKPLWEEK